MKCIGEKLLKVIQTYQKLRTPVKAAFWFTVMAFFQKGISFFVTPLYTRMLSVEEYGYYSLFLSWISFFSPIATLNLSGGGFNNGMMKYENDRKQYVSSIQALGYITVSIFFIIIFIFKDWIMPWSGLDKILLISMFLYLLFDPPFSYWAYYQRYQFQYKALVIITILSTILAPVINLTLLRLVNSNRQYVFIIGTTIAKVVTGLFFTIYNFIQGKVWFRKKYWSFALRFNIPLIPHYLSHVVLGQVDRIMIGYYAGKKEVAIYSLTYNISLLLNILFDSVLNAMTPYLFKKLKEKDYKSMSKNVDYILFLFVGILLCSVLIIPELLSFLGTGEYEEGRWIVAPVMLGSYFMVLCSFFGTVQFYNEKSIYIMITSVTAAVSNVIMNAIFIPIFGYIIAGYTTLASYVIFSIIQYFFMSYVCKKERMGCIYNIRTWVLLSIIVSVLTMCEMFLYPYVWIRYGMLAGVALLCLINYKKLAGIWNILLGSKDKDKKGIYERG